MRATSIGATAAMAAACACALVVACSAFDADEADDGTDAGPDAARDAGGDDAGSLRGDSGAADAAPVATTYRDIVKQDAPVVYLPLDEPRSGTTTTTTTTASGKSFTTGDWIFGESGVGGGTGVRIAPKASATALAVGHLDVSGRREFSLELWIQADSDTKIMTPISVLNGADNVVVTINSGAKGNIALIRYVELMGGPGSADVVYADITKRLTHVVGTYDGDSLRLYVDGALQNT